MCVCSQNKLYYSLMVLERRKQSTNPLCVLAAKQGRLHNFQVGLTSTLPTTADDPQQSPHLVCLNYNGSFPYGRRMLKCNNTVRGRYLFIQIMDRDTDSYLTLCEVEVYCECC